MNQSRRRAVAATPRPPEHDPIRIPASWMRGGTSKGLFFVASDLPANVARRDAMLLRALGSPDPYGKQIDGLGGASSSTSKVMIVAPSVRVGCDVDYWFGQVPIDRAEIDWSGNCGNLTAAVGPFALERGLVTGPLDGTAVVRMWQANVGRRIVSHVPMRDGRVVESGLFRIDGVAFPSAPIRIDFIDPAGEDGAALFPTSNPIDRLEVAGEGVIEASLVAAGNPMALVAASALGVDMTHDAHTLNRNPRLLARCEAIRVAASIAMGLTADEDAARGRGHTPKLVLLAAPTGYTAVDGRSIGAELQDLSVRVLSMGAFHHAIPGTAAIALAAAAARPGTLAHRLARPGDGLLRLGHLSGVTEVDVRLEDLPGGGVKVGRATMLRSARRLMDGVVCVPESS